LLNNDIQNDEENIENEEDENEENSEEDLNNNNDNYIYIKFVDKKYNIITEMAISKVTKDIYNMFQYNENIIVFINNSYLTLIDLKYYEIISKIKTDQISFAYFFTNIWIKTNFINYLVLKTNNKEESFSNDSISNNDNENNSEDDNNYIYFNDVNNEEENNIEENNIEENNIEENEDDESNINVYYLNNLIDGINEIKCINNNGQEINLNDYINPEHLLDISITCDNKDKNCNYLIILNKDLRIKFSRIKFVLEK